MVNQIYSSELQLNIQASTSDTDASFLGLHLSIFNDIVSILYCNTRYLGSYPPFWLVFKMAAVKNDKMAILCNINLLPSVMLTFMSRTSISKTINFSSDNKKLNVCS